MIFQRKSILMSPRQKPAAKPEPKTKTKAAAKAPTSDTPKKAKKAEVLPAKIPSKTPTKAPDSTSTDIVTAEPELKISAASDALRAYLNDLRKIPPLSSDEEIALAKRLHEQGDLQAAKLLVSANLRIVVRIAYEYRSIYTNLMDLVQEGNIGLMKAVSKFDPAKGARLGYYASWWIRSYILKYILDNFRLVRVGTSQAQKKLFYHLVREQQKLEAQGIYPATALLAEKIGVKEKDVIEMSQRLSSQGAELSIETPTHGEDSDKNVGQTLVDDHESISDKMERDEWLGILEQHLPDFRKTLNSREQSVLDERILSEEPKTLQEVADKYGLTRERVRQIETKLIEKLRERLRNRME